MKVEPTVTNPSGVRAPLPQNEKSPSGEFSITPQDILEPPEELRPLTLKESKLRMKEVFMDGVADLEANAMIQGLSQEKAQEGSK